MKPGGQAITRQDLLDTAVVAGILVVHSAVPFFVRIYQGRETFASAIIKRIFNGCVVTSWPLLGIGGVLLALAAQALSGDTADRQHTMSSTEPQIRWAGFGAAVMSVGCILQSAGGLFWLAEARLHSKSRPLIALDLLSSAIIAMIGIHLAQFVLSIREPLLEPESFDMPAEPRSSTKRGRGR